MLALQSILAVSGLAIRLGLLSLRRSLGYLRVYKLSVRASISSGMCPAATEAREVIAKLAQGRVFLLSWPTHLHGIALCMTKHQPAGRFVRPFADPVGPAFPFTR